MSDIRYCTIRGEASEESRPTFRFCFFFNAFFFLSSFSFSRSALNNIAQ